MVFTKDSFVFTCLKGTGEGNYSQNIRLSLHYPRPIRPAKIKFEFFGVLRVFYEHIDTFFIQIKQ